MVQWLGLCVSTAVDPGSIPAQGTKILQALWRGKKRKKEETMKMDKVWKSIKKLCTNVSNINSLD